MNFKEVAEKRASVRNFRDEAVPLEALKEMIRIANTAPCVSGEETWKFIVITNKELLGKMADAVKVKYRDILTEKDSPVTDKVLHTVEKFSTVFRLAPAVIAVLLKSYEAIIDKALENTGYNHQQINELRNYPDIQTAGAAIENLLLAAVDMDYGACWLTGPMIAKEELSGILNIRKPYSLIAFVAVGKPDKTPVPRKKKSLDEILEIIE